MNALGDRPLTATQRCERWQRKAEVETTAAKDIVVVGRGTGSRSTFSLIEVPGPSSFRSGQSGT